MAKNKKKTKQNKTEMTTNKRKKNERMKKFSKDETQMLSQYFY